MKRKSLSAAMMALFAGAGLPLAAQAGVPVVIDNFLNQAVVQATNQTVSIQTAGTSSNILGGYRDLLLTASGGASISVDAQCWPVTALLGCLRISNDNNSDSTVSIQWDGNDSASPAGVVVNGISPAVDLTSGRKNNEIRFSTVFQETQDSTLPPSHDYTWKLTVYEGNSSVSRQVTQLAPATVAGLPVAITAKMTDFTTSSGDPATLDNFDAVTAVTLDVSFLVKSSDITVGPITANGDCTGTIGNYVWLDNNGDGIQNTGDEPLEGILLNLYTGAGALLSSTTSNTDGSYQFTQLCPGDYLVQADGGVLTSSPTRVGTDRTVDSNNPLPNLLNPQQDDVVTLTASNPSDQTIDFGFIGAPEPIPASLGNRVWLDEDRDGVQDPTEPGVGGVLITLTGTVNGNPFTLEKTTDSNGYYLFDVVPGVAYTATCVKPAGYDYTPIYDQARETGLEGENSNANPSNGLMNPVAAPFVLGNGEELLSVDCGLVKEGGDGCTLGYWKQSQHFASWTSPYIPSGASATKFKDVFGEPGVVDAFGNKTLLQVLQLTGGGLNALGRDTVAALLNAASTRMSYDLTTAQVIAKFKAVYPGTTAAYTTLKNEFSVLNEQVNAQGVHCPL